MAVCNAYFWGECGAENIFDLRGGAVLQWKYLFPLQKIRRNRFLKNAGNNFFLINFNMRTTCILSAEMTQWYPNEHHAGTTKPYQHSWSALDYTMTSKAADDGTDENKNTNGMNMHLWWFVSATWHHNTIDHQFGKELGSDPCTKNLP